MKSQCGKVVSSVGFYNMFKCVGAWNVWFPLALECDLRILSADSHNCTARTTSNSAQADPQGLECHHCCPAIGLYILYSRNV